MPQGDPATGEAPPPIRVALKVDAVWTDEELCVNIEPLLPGELPLPDFDHDKAQDEPAPNHK